MFNIIIKHLIEFRFNMAMVLMYLVQFNLIYIRRKYFVLKKNCGLTNVFNREQLDTSAF